MKTTFETRRTDGMNKLPLLRKHFVITAMVFYTNTNLERKACFLCFYKKVWIFYWLLGQHTFVKRLKTQTYTKD